MEDSKATGAYVDPNRSRVTVGMIAEQWRSGKLNLKPTTRAVVDSVLSVHVLPRWQNVPLQSVEHGDVQAWIGKGRDDLAFAAPGGGVFYATATHVARG